MNKFLVMPYSPVGREDPSARFKSLWNANDQSKDVGIRVNGPTEIVVEKESENGINANFNFERLVKKPKGFITINNTQCFELRII